MGERGGLFDGESNSLLVVTDGGSVNGKSTLNIRWVLVGQTVLGPKRRRQVLARVFIGRTK